MRTCAWFWLAAAIIRYRGPVRDAPAVAAGDAPAARFVRSDRPVLSGREDHRS
jgi:hypothetical protein